jgi:hypothetical protein
MHTREADPLRLLFTILFKRLRGSLNQKEFALDVFLDIDGAFDNATFGSMNAASGEHGFVLTLHM